MNEQLIAATIMMLVMVSWVLWMVWKVLSWRREDQKRQKRKFMHELKYGEGNPSPYDIG